MNKITLNPLSFEKCSSPLSVNHHSFETHILKPIRIWINYPLYIPLEINRRAAPFHVFDPLYNADPQLSCDASSCTMS